MRDAGATLHRPGLAALVVYARPTPRSRLLRLLADLGVFVVEHQGVDDARHTAMSTRTDLVIVVGDDDPRHAALAVELLRALSSVLVAIVPTGVSAARYVAAGACVTLADDVADVDFGPVLRPALREARLLRNLGQMAAEYIVFRDVRFRISQPDLVREGAVVPLTRVESEVLLLLSRNQTRTVANADLERCLVSLSSRSELHAGYAKTIIRRIRKKVAEVGGDPKQLRSVRGIGYVLTA